ncbi:hypothetical protein ADIARSV_3011 [Arcticibacter svalbardensis MN12-7]|uniref:GmrSD restriction endonucleases N-terminal domain-containing protein n=1 Tax=Arcticibacter svalbardensis MN12-7 TaxID=1150600 RepID=R9GY15_9SPHI|nr:DUF262 domain-containing protein [Arcticibacter svalbardensis]EOR93874.1 hypothetical protein ADIARSV_3011 [Arcticibacter svalbardensis MN12-7]
MEIREIFENLIKIEAKVMSIESLFNNPDRVKKTNYKPFYQRNYVWDDEKASYFIESILLGTEIPPLIFFRSKDHVEVIDGRQRYQTILRFKNNDFKLKKIGLRKLENIGIANKLFKDIGHKYEDLFWDTKLRIIEFSFHTKSPINDEIEEVVKKEIFKRYNSGITPLKQPEIDKAIYFEDDLNTFIKGKLKSDQVLYNDISRLLHFEKTNTEIILKKIRQLLVQHQIPIKYYAVKKDTVISKYYEFLFSKITEEEIQSLFNSFIEKINLLKKIKYMIDNQMLTYNRLMSECLFWAFSIMEAEGLLLTSLNKDILKELVYYIKEHMEAFEMDRSSFSKELHNRYLITSDFFSGKFDINFNIYLQTSSDFKEKDKHISLAEEEGVSFDELRINKPEPSTTAILDICRQMTRQRFLIRPPYQRNEVINKKKSSSIIESILLGIKLPPIFVYKREDDISEVLDGQQRLLSILGFIGKPYLDENNKTRNSDKNGYSLSLKNGILKNLHGDTFEQLSQEEKDKIINYDLWIIEISQKNNSNFEPIDLFIRLNNKPYPIKEDTFEMWNSYISRDIVQTIKTIYRNNKDWFYFRKNNSRMENENIYTALAFLQFRSNSTDDGNVTKDLDIYRIVDKINLRLKSKNEITKVLEDSEFKDEFITASDDLEFNFLKTLKELISDGPDTPNINLNKNLDNIFNVENGRRTQQSFYALWYFLNNIPFEIVIQEKSAMRIRLGQLFKYMSGIESKKAFDEMVEKFNFDFSSRSDRPLNFNTGKLIEYVAFGNVTISFQGVNPVMSTKNNAFENTEDFALLNKVRFQNLKLVVEEFVNVTLEEKEILHEFSEQKGKILVSKNANQPGRLTAAYYDGKGIFTSYILCVSAVRYGFAAKYLIAIISSRYTYNKLGKYFVFLNQNESRQLSLTQLREIPVPRISSIKQRPFIIIVDYMLVSDIRIQVYLFFQRILDAMVYELFLGDTLKEANADLLQYLVHLPELKNDEQSNKEMVESVYNSLSSVDHPVSASLLKILNINEIILIEAI